jgi:putative ATP-dependent endonuclease of OLD family
MGRKVFCSGFLAYECVVRPPGFVVNGPSVVSSRNVSTLKSKPMRLVSFSVTNFRSITSAHKIPVRDSTVLLGRNNEGKSNVLKALSIAMKTLKSHAANSGLSDGEGPNRNPFSWLRDFPIALQRRTRGTDSIFRLEFELTEEETEDFRKTIKSSLNGSLPIEIKYGKDNVSGIRVTKQGPGGSALSKKSKTIAKYVAERIQFVYIPAVRTEGEALSVVQEMLSAELAQLEYDPAYAAALDKIAELQQPILTRVSESIKKSLAQFLPVINSVSVRIPRLAQQGALRRHCQVEIDDGTKTLLEYKGDGVKSLAALGLIKDKEIVNGASIVAIEEPESHLHPGAIHSLREVIDTLSSSSQVVLTTHCPLFVDRDHVGRNIIIDSGNVQPARDVAAIRKLLGIRASDNLVNASHVLVVEGDDDVVVLNALLPHLSHTLSKALSQRHLVIESIGGAGNLSYNLSLLSNALCVTHVLLDHDESGRRAFEKAEKQINLKLVDVTFVRCDGMQDSEMEDVFDLDVYRDAIHSTFGVNLECSQFRGNAKWSERIKKCFTSQGKTWNDSSKAQVKAEVARAVARSPAAALHDRKRSAIESLVRALEDKIRPRAVSSQ